MEKREFPDLPKWPQCIIIGDAVTEMQAYDIILRTDRFLTGLMEYYGGNEHEFNQDYIAQCLRGTPMEELYREYTEVSSDYPKRNAYYSAVQAIRTELDRRLGIVELDYVYNRWASSSYIMGPAGFVSPKGTICFGENVGKWPSGEDIYRDFKHIAEAFPYLKLKVAVYDGEMSDDDAKPMFGLTVSNGKVRVVKDQPCLRGELGYNYEERMNNMIGNMFRPGRELGLPNHWYTQMASEVNRAIKEIFKEKPSILEVESN